jgi:hypothetical protein
LFTKYSPKQEDDFLEWNLFHYVLALSLNIKTLIQIECTALLWGFEFCLLTL